MKLVATHRTQSKQEWTNVWRNYRYTYGGAKTDVHRGWLGFRWKTIVDVERDTSTHALYMQYYPLTGIKYAARTWQNSDPNSKTIGLYLENILK